MKRNYSLILYDKKEQKQEVNLDQTIVEKLTDILQVRKNLFCLKKDLDKMCESILDSQKNIPQI